MTSAPASPSICDSLRDARERAGYTLEELAALTGLSKAHLSRLESGERQPSVAALLTLGRALGVPVGSLLGDSSSGSALAVFDEDQPRRVTKGLTISALSGFDRSRLLEAVRIVVDPDREPPVPSRHRGEEWLYVLAGILVLEYGSETHELTAGQAAHFDAEQLHRLGARGGEAEILLVSVDVPNDTRRNH
jgi:transcriptional regulator with XRE-family HTH domain